METLSAKLIEVTEGVSNNLEDMYRAGTLALSDLETERGFQLKFYADCFGIEPSSEELALMIEYSQELFGL
jgi:hypothetical protein